VGEVLRQHVGVLVAVLFATGEVLMSVDDVEAEDVLAQLFLGVRHFDP